METLTIGFEEIWFVLFGNRSLRALGLTRVEVTKKKINNRKTMSVMEDMLNEGLTFDLRLIDIIVSFFIYLLAREEGP